MYSIQKNVMWSAFIVLVALMLAGKAPAKEPLGASVCKSIIGADGIARPGPSCLSESEIAPCKAFLEKALPAYINQKTEELKKRQGQGDQVRAGWLQKDLDEINGSSSPLLAYALQNPPYSPLYDLKTTNMFIKSQKENIAILKSGDENRMRAVIGIAYQGQALEQRLAGDEEFLCMLNVRLSQLAIKQPKPAAGVAKKPRP